MLLGHIGGRFIQSLTHNTTIFYSYIHPLIRSEPHNMVYRDCFFLSDYLFYSVLKKHGSFSHFKTTLNFKRFSGRFYVIKPYKVVLWSGRKRFFKMQIKIWKVKLFFIHVPLAWPS